MDQDKIYQLQDSVHRFRRSQRKSKTASMSDLLANPKGSLSSLVHNINRINRLSQSLTSVLPDPLAKHCRVSRFEEQQLVIAVDSGEWASRLRYEKLELLSHLRANGFANIHGIDIVVNPADFQGNTE